MPFGMGDRAGCKSFEFGVVCGIQRLLAPQEIAARAITVDAIALDTRSEDNATDNLRYGRRGALRDHPVPPITRPVAHRDWIGGSGDFNLLLGQANLAKASDMH
ncbi:MAG: hypothetical protein JWP25_1577 [Bradyrhizobium sp.]|nr:hypothetical protein [Bradyrhizobium sp.]